MAQPPGGQDDPQKEVTMVETAKVTPITAIAAFELEQRLVTDRMALGMKGNTLGKVDGRGLQGGPRRVAGLVDAPNLRLEMFVATLGPRRLRSTSG
jgi:hypothetical protein